MKRFLEFLGFHSKIKLNFILFLIILALIPGRNYYYQLNLSDTRPLIRQIDYSFPSLLDYPINLTAAPAPFLTARSAIVVDVDSKAILFSKNPNLTSLPASTTKIMTALVSLDIYRLNDILTVKNLGSEGQLMDLEPNEKITMENLLYGLLVQSGNDAADVLADYHPQGTAGFVKAMNQKLADLNLKDSHYINPSGLDAYGQYTTAHDLGLLTAVAMTDPVFKKIVSTQKITVTDIDNTISHELETINQLLGHIPGLSGVKTGWTELAGECLVAFTSRNNRQIITVVLGSQSRFDETAQLIDWVFNNHRWSSAPLATH